MFFDFFNLKVSTAFIGRLNVLQRTDRRFLGEVFFYKGLILRANFKGLHGKNALFALLLFLENSAHYIEFILEPELIPPKEAEFKFSLKDLFKEYEDFKNQKKLIKNLRPPADLVLKRNPAIEKDLLKKEELLIWNFLEKECLVTEIFKQLPYEEDFCSMLLVSLRKKKAILVAGGPDKEVAHLK